MSTDVTPRTVDYQFADGAPTGSWLGLGTPRLVVCGTGLLLTAAAFGLRAPILAAGTPLLVALTLSFCFVGNRPLIGWARPAAAQLAGGVTSTSQQSARLQPGAPANATRLRLPPEFGRADLSDTNGPLPIAVLDRQRERTRTVVFELAGVDRFALLDRADQDRLLAGWGRVLVGLGAPQTGVRRIQLLEHASSVPTRLQADPADTNAELTAALAASGSTRMSLLAVEFAPRTVERAADLVEACRRLAGQMLVAEVAARPLASVEVLPRIRQLLHPGTHGCGPDTLLARSRRGSWDHVRIDDYWHRGFAVSSWPRSPVPANWLEPLLIAAPAGAARTFSAHLFPLPAQSASRIARTARARVAVDRADRARLGLTASAAADRAAENTVAMDEELAAGHIGYRLTALLTCTAGSLYELDAACAQMLDAAATARLDCQPLHGQHPAAVAAVLPAGPLRCGGAW